MRSILTTLLLTIATQAGAECGNLCDYNWWRTATEADVQAELDGGADVDAKNKSFNNDARSGKGRHSSEH